MRPQQIDLARVGIETRYAGTVFRSRLEARWAAMFDLLEWRWDYEPVDLSGYVPDFFLHFPRGVLLAEVKPATDRLELEANARKIQLSGWRKDFLLLGAGPLATEPAPVLGLFAYFEEWPGDEPGWMPPDDAEVHRCLRCQKTSFHHASGSWFCPVCGAYDGNAYIESVDSKDVVAMWREAGNRVQWRKGI